MAYGHLQPDRTWQLDRALSVGQIYQSAIVLLHSQPGKDIEAKQEICIQELVAIVWEVVSEAK